MNENSRQDRIPSALLVKRGFSWIILAPVSAALIAVCLVFQSVGERGIPVTITFRQGHGLKMGDAVRYRGIEIGVIQSVGLARSLDLIEVKARLRPFARDVARTGSRFWIVRPRLGMGGISGLETMIGANYVNALPGEGEKADLFKGLEDPPILEIMEGGGLEIVLETPGKGGLGSGAPVKYRQVIVGAILSVGLSRDSGSVEAKAYILPDYAPLIRENTRFWKSGGAEVSAGITGFSIRLDSLESLLSGGVELAVPPDSGRPADVGRRFFLHEEPEPEWLKWKPFLDIRKDRDARFEIPPPMEMTVKWKGLLRKRKETAWVLPMKNGFLGPSDPLDRGNGKKEVSFFLGETRIFPSSVSEKYSGGLAFLPAEHSLSPFPSSLCRKGGPPENIKIVAGARMNHRFISSDHLTREGKGWKIKAGLDFNENWNGAFVLGDKDGALLGMLVLDGNDVNVVFVSEILIE